MKKISTTLFVLTFLLLNLFTSCDTDDNEDLEFRLIESPNNSDDEKKYEKILEDSRDGQKYKTVKIGNQIWMAENLNYSTNLSICYGFNASNCQKYGKLYQWNEAINACPDGWHLPDITEWAKMITFLGGPSAAMHKLKDTTTWSGNTSQSTNEYGFTALPGGRSTSNYTFFSIGRSGYWWTSTSTNANQAKDFYISETSTSITEESSTLTVFQSCRCVKD
jgi:uncharacterized protein (TIGR02145 family)